MLFTASLKKTTPLFHIAPVHARNRESLRTRAKGNWMLPRSRLGGSPCGSAVNGFAAGDGYGLLLNVSNISVANAFIPIMVYAGARAAPPPGRAGKRRERGGARGGAECNITCPVYFQKNRKSMKRL